MPLALILLDKDDMKLKFKIRLLSIAAVSTGGLICLLMVLSNAIIRHPERINGVIAGVMIFFTVTILILLREMKFKWNAIEINDKELIVKPFLGLGPARRINFSEVTGFNRSWEPSKTSDGLAIYIYVDNKRAIEISDAYCKNFQEVYDELKIKIRELGDEDFKIFKNVFNAFGVPIKLTTKQSER